MQQQSRTRLLKREDGDIDLVVDHDVVLTGSYREIREEISALSDLIADPDLIDIGQINQRVWDQFYTSAVNLITQPDNARRFIESGVSPSGVIESISAAESILFTVFEYENGFFPVFSGAYDLRGQPLELDQNLPELHVEITRAIEVEDLFDLNPEGFGRDWSLTVHKP